MFNNGDIEEARKSAHGHGHGYSDAPFVGWAAVVICLYGPLSVPKPLTRKRLLCGGRRLLISELLTGPCQAPIKFCIVRSLAVRRPQHGRECGILIGLKEFVGFGEAACGNFRSARTLA
jgi:hypothetical protein